MARTKKEKIEPTSSEIPESEVWDVLKFASSIYNGAYGIPGVYSPQLVSSRMKEIGLHPMLATADKIDTALSNPRDSERELVGYTQWLELNNMLFKRILGYYSGLLSFDIYYNCKNVKDEDEYTSPAYLRDLKIVTDFFYRFNIKQEFKTIMRQLLRQEAYFGVLRDEGEKITFQELNEQFCVVTGRSDEVGLLFDFDLTYLLQSGVNIDMLPPIFKKWFNEVFNNGNTKPYNPALPVDSRNSSYVLYHQTSPKDNFFCFKFTPEIAARVPWISPLMGDAILQPVIRTLQKNSYIQQASKLIYTQVPLMNKDLKGATVKDAVAISPDLLGKFLALVSQALPDAVKIAASPTEQTQSFSWDGNNEIYQSYLQNTAASSGVNSRLIFSIDRQNVQETNLSMDIDQNVLSPLYHPFSNFLEYYVNRLTKKYKFKFTLEGFETTSNRKERFDTQMTLCDKGIVLPARIASSLGMLPNDFYQQLAEGRAMKFVDKLTPIINATQMSGKASEKTGRPQKSDSELTDSGEQTRADGSNLGRGGEV